MDTAAEPVGEKVSRKKKYEPIDDDYKLSSLSIDDAENGVVVSCSYRLNDEASEKMRKSDNYSGGWCEPDKHVFEKKNDAKAFIMSEIDALFGGDV